MITTRKSIRNNVFETNSSSTHSICVTKNYMLDQKMNFIKFVAGEFGWEEDVLRSPSIKASYLYTAILYTEKPELIDKIKSALDSNGIKYEFVEPEENEWFYIDHAHELYDFLSICSDEDELMRFLFSSESFVLTGNDNSDTDVDIKVDYPHEEYYKGN